MKKWHNAFSRKWITKWRSKMTKNHKLTLEMTKNSSKFQQRLNLQYYWHVHFTFFFCSLVLQACPTVQKMQQFSSSSSSVGISHISCHIDRDQRQWQRGCLVVVTPAVTWLWHANKSPQTPSIFMIWKTSRRSNTVVIFQLRDRIVTEQSLKRRGAKLHRRTPIMKSHCHFTFITDKQELWRRAKFHTRARISYHRCVKGDIQPYDTLLVPQSRLRGIFRNPVENMTRKGRKFTWRSSIFKGPYYQDKCPLFVNSVLILHVEQVRDRKRARSGQ